MKKEYEEPKVEKMDFDYSDKVVASGGLTDEASTNWWKCETRHVDVYVAATQQCGYLPNAQ